MLDSSLSVTQSGIQAHQLLAGEQSGSVLGVVKRGAYLRFESGWVVFLSFGPYHGPLTLNLGGDIEPILALRPGVKVKAHAGTIDISEPDFEIDTRGAPVWAAPVPSANPLSPVEREENLAAIAQSRLVGPRSVDSSPLLPALFEPAGPDGKLSGLVGRNPDLASVREALHGGQPSQVASTLEPFLGWGIGLTPSGDDLGMVVRPIYERTDLVNKAVGTATRALIEGSILVAVILFLFLGELRSALVVIVTLPLAMLIAFIGMGQAGLSANLMSLAGLAIGIGMMVDGAVVMVENAYRIMAERRAHGERVDRTSAVLAAAHEVANPIAFAILIIIVVFLPLFALTGLEGKLFKPMALTITFAMIGSFLLTMTLGFLAHAI